MSRIYVILLIAVLFFATATAQLNRVCSWGLRLTTSGTYYTAATNSTISLIISAPAGHLGRGFTIPDLNVYNRNPDQGYLPFRRNGVDNFDFLGPCSPFTCNITLASDGAGTDPAWRLQSVAANTTFLRLPVRQYPTVTVDAWILDSPLTVNLCNH